MTEFEFEKKIHLIVKEMEYPRMPDIAGAVMTRLHPVPHSRFIYRRLAWSLTIILVLLSSLMLIPTVRAVVIEFIQIGIVRIFPRTVEQITTTVPGYVTQDTAVPSDSSPLLIPFLDRIAGETDLIDAQKKAPYPIFLPAYPADIGQPNRVYVQDAEGVMTILVWVDPGQPEHVTMSLHFIPVGHWAINKFGPVVIQATEVNSQQAIWAEGPYPLIMQNGDLFVERLIDGHVLIWEGDNITYRLETELPLEEAIRIAESLEPIP